jgi:hypothetical protein
MLEKVSGLDIEIIDAYFDEFYKIYNTELQEKTTLFQSQWDEVEEKFINEAESLFNGFKFPEGKYIGYISSFNCNPRFLDNKTFQIFYKSNSSVNIVSHEIMHFIFYAYTSNKFPTLTQNLDINSGLWWDAAEVFNNVILSSEKFIRILKTKGDVGYPDHQKFILNAKDLYQQSLDIDDFIKSLFDLLG